MARQADDSKKASTLRAKLKLNPNSPISLPTENIEFLSYLRRRRGQLLNLEYEEHQVDVVSLLHIGHIFFDTPVEYPEGALFSGTGGLHGFHQPSFFGKLRTTSGKRIFLFEESGFLDSSNTRSPHEDRRRRL